MGLFDNLFGRRHNVERGQDVEHNFKAQAEMTGDKVERTGIGSDYKRTRIDPLTGRKTTEYWETKRNKSPISKRQMQTRGLKVYRETDGLLGPESRAEDKHGNELQRNIFNGRMERVRKKDKDPFGMNSMFGSTSNNKTRRTKSDDPLGFGSMFGGSNTGKRRKKSESDWF